MEEIDFLFGENRLSYLCSIKNFTFSADKIYKPVGKYIPAHRNGKIIEININKCTLTKVPQLCLEHFPNLKTLRLTNCKLKSISKDDFKGLNKFTEVDFSYNEIEYLPGDLFEHMKQLESVDFYENKIKFIEPNLFDGMKELKFIELS